MDEAASLGLLRRPEERAGGSWEALLTRLDAALQPLRELGWTTGDSSHQESWEFGDSVVREVTRDGVSYSAEMYFDDALALWRIEDDDESEEQQDELGHDDDPDREVFFGEAEGVSWARSDCTRRSSGTGTCGFGLLP